MTLVLAVGGCRAALQQTTSASIPASSSVAASTSPQVPSPTALPTGIPGPRSDSFPVLPGSEPPGTGLNAVTCTGPIGAQDPVAVVQLHGTPEKPGDFVLRDYADVAHPTTVCNLGASPMQLIDGRHALINAGSAGAVVDLPEVRFHWFQLPVTPGWGSELITVSPALDQIVWRSVDPQGSRSDMIHITTAAGDRVVATLLDTNEGRCSSPDDSRYGEFTLSGNRLYVLNQPLDPGQPPRGGRRHGRLLGAPAGR